MSLPRSLLLGAGALSLLAGCVVRQPVARAPAYAPTGYAQLAPAPDPYCREARQEARAATREARAAAQEANRSAYAGAPGWAQAQDAERARDAAAEADRARHYARRDC